MVEEYLWEQVVGSRLCLDTALAICENGDGMRFAHPEQCFREQCGDHLFHLCQFLLSNKCDPSKVPYFNDVHRASTAVRCTEAILPPLPAASELLEQGRG